MKEKIYLIWRFELQNHLLRGRKSILSNINRKHGTKTTRIFFSKSFISEDHESRKTLLQLVLFLLAFPMK